ncbi:MAG: orotidine-5'-phosphate decarboxylase [Phycisphaerales bacterium]|nr:orotidine-5'-phosphate decarboxylase [Phycisphaerales bacterium]
MGATKMSPMEQLASSIDKAQSCACIGIDPVFDRLPEELKEVEPPLAIAMFAKVVLDHIHEVAGVVKFQSACFERYGQIGYAVLERSVAHAKSLGLTVILDAKRGDIGSSAEHYAAGAKAMGADMITCSPYMGRSSIEPFVNAGLGVFALCKTSNPDAAELQSKEMTAAVGRMICDLGEQVGAVVGATNTLEETKTLRRIMPASVFLVPGVGAQGGTIDDVKAMVRPNATLHSHLGVVINASRSVLYPDAVEDEPWHDTVKREAQAFAQSCRQLLD